jgi:antitoxin FitA
MWVAAMGDLSIKHVPENQIEALRRRAEKHHRSLQGELRAMLDEYLGKPERMTTVTSLLESGRKLGLSTPAEAARWLREDRDR